MLAKEARSKIGTSSVVVGLEYSFIVVVFLLAIVQAVASIAAECRAKVVELLLPILKGEGTLEGFLRFQLYVRHSA